MLRIKYKLSECLSPLHKHECPPVEDFLATILPRPADTGGIRGKLPPKSFLCLPNFVVLRKICFSLPHKP